MDTFSLSILYGTVGIDIVKSFILSTIVGVFHFIMPLLGNLIGYNIIKKMPISSSIFVGIILIIIGIQMIFQKEQIINLKKIRSFFIFGITVSLDSFSLGIGLSGITNKYLTSYITFALTSFIFTILGLSFGKVLNKIFGNLSTKIGGILLIVIGIAYIL